MKTYIAYQGIQYTIEWYYDNKGKSKSLEYYLNSSDDKKRKIIALFKLMATYAKIHDTTKFRYEGNHIYAFKPQPDRYLCFFFEGKKIIITNAFEKKTQKLSEQEKNRALKAHQDYKIRITKGTYYEKK